MVFLRYGNVVEDTVTGEDKLKVAYTLDPAEKKKNLRGTPHSISYSNTYAHAVVLSFSILSIIYNLTTCIVVVWLPSNHIDTRRPVQVHLQRV